MTRSQRGTGAVPPDTSPTRPRRHALWLLLVPAVLYCLAPFVANRIEPVILGMPFLLLWMVAATVISPLVIWLVARLDPIYRAGAPEPVPADDAPAHGRRVR
ncbi:DUF3311 domain-containing protein [Marinactinospora thermotolerans]|uniref:DUF3311 domain-containing protein n=1 Tax=Marinactinospora thermotolerans DSM 45154 TaxID=1122192 RepID=A0A1T4ND47_9ACTN|nr:DUF3311 domain-containing protein [Marinactinospora thermotolerans]SJZ76966.1 Protein of unknown function [Marinactinospora thermotolerans DSM 45154]